MGKDENVASFRFGGFELQPGERRLLANGQPAAVNPRAFDLLLALVERAGKLVSKNELLDLVWPNLVVEENNLQVHVSALRKILGPDAIATIPGHGYRFTVELTREGAEPAVPAMASIQNLPQQLTSFVGRARELTDVQALLSKTRLLTLAGFGGIGKTRLSLQAASGVLNDYPDGVWFVELAPLTDARFVPQAAASVLGVKEAAGRPVLEALLMHVKNRRLLFILDSCEHLLDACAELAKQLLQTGPHVTVLATSRERLNLGGETIYPVPALAMPKPNQPITLTALTQYEAVRLFIDRAAAAQPAFRLTDRNATAVTDICRRVDGIPLAIELAAARVRALSVEKIAERLSDRFRLLTRGDRTALPHRQTLRALIDWSHELLNEHERAVLRRLAVFPGGFTLEAAEAVGAGGAIDVADVLDLLTELIEKSMVVVEANGERYRLLDTVRQYACERLDESGDGDSARERHLAFYLAFAEKAWPELSGPKQGEWFTRLDLERENLLVAHAWCGRAEDSAELGLRLVFALLNYWIHRGGLELGFRVTVEALTRTPARRSLDRCRALYVAAKLARCLGQYADAQRYVEEDLSIAREIGDGESVAKALRMLGEQCCAEGQHSEAHSYLEEGIALTRQLEQKRPLSQALLELADLYRLEEDFDAAEPLYEESLALAREVGDLRNIVFDLLSLASVSVARGSGERTPQMLLEALAIIEQIGSKPLGAYLLLVSAGFAAFLGEWRRAAQLYGTGVVQHAQLVFHPEPAEEAFLVPLLARAREALGTAAFAAAEAAGRALSYDTALGEARAWLETASESQVVPPATQSSNSVDITRAPDGIVPK
jgi:predicted ATPase/DNA-binding winged helix-turn-helix (wHTH) protein